MMNRLQDNKTTFLASKNRLTEKITTCISDKNTEKKENNKHRLLDTILK